MKQTEKNLNLTGVPETMLLTLYGRASEARRPDGILQDPEAIRIFDSIEYDFAGNFGRATGGNASRSLIFDRYAKQWMEDHPDGLIVSLGEGLETQISRIDNGQVRWLTIDLPESIAAREKFIKPTDRFRHLAKSALDFSWMDEVDDSKGVLFIAQGLFMYFEEKQVGELIQTLAKRFPQGFLLFDRIPPWLSKKTQKGLKVTPKYQLPPMPWGVRRDHVAEVLRGWAPQSQVLADEVYEVFTRGFGQFLFNIVKSVSFLQANLMSVVYARLDTFQKES